MKRSYTFSICILYLLVFSSSLILYKSRKHLNETVLGNNRFAVDNFVDNNRIIRLSNYLKKHKQFFQRYGNNYKLPMADVLFQGIFSGDIIPNCTWGVECTPLPDQALHVLKSTSHKYVDNELLKDVENYIHIRDKLFEYASEVLNTTVSLTQFGAFFYFFPKKVKSEIFVNGTEYIFAPHSDLCGFKTFDQPLILDRSEPHNLYRKYTVVLYIDVPPPSAQAGGIFKFIDLPNRYKLPVKRAKQYSKNGYMYVDGGAFADPEATFLAVEPARGKVLLFPAVSHLHAVTGYTGNTDRYALSMFLTDKEGNYEQLRDIMPKIELDDPHSIAHEYYKRSHPNEPEPESESESESSTDYELQSSSSSSSLVKSSGNSDGNGNEEESTIHDIVEESTSSLTSSDTLSPSRKIRNRKLSRNWYYNP